MPTGKEIMQRADRLLNDADHVRWPLSELADWINEAVNAIVLAKPSATSTTVTIELVAGTRQLVPGTGTPTPLNLLDVIRNVDADGNGGRAISVVPRNILDASDPDWHDKTKLRQRKVVTNVTFDEKDPLTFYTYPGNDGTGHVEAVTSTQPAPLTAIADVEGLDAYADDIGLPEPYSVVVLDYVLHRCFSKDDLQGAPGQSQAYYSKFANALGIKVSSEFSNSPNSRRVAS